MNMWSFSFNRCDRIQVWPVQVMDYVRVLTIQIGVFVHFIKQCV